MIVDAGVASPSVVGALLLVYTFAIALLTGLGLLFIVSLPFISPKALFSKWLCHGIGTLFSLAVLSFMVSVAMKVIKGVAGVMIAKYTLAAEGLFLFLAQQRKGLAAWLCNKAAWG